MTEAIRQRIGTRVRAARLRAKLSQEALGAKIKRTPESISNIERGQQLPTIETLLDLADVLELSLVDVFDVRGETRKLSRQRQLTESQIAETVKDLSDTVIDVALVQLEALKSIK